MHRRLTLAGAAAVVGCSALIASGLANADTDDASAPDSLKGAFADAASTYDVPRDVLASLAYTESRFVQHDGPSQDNGYGLMHLESNADNHNLERASRLTDHSVDELQSDATANIDGAAAVLRKLADRSGLDGSDRSDLAQWYVPLAKYARGQTKYGAKLEADAVFDNVRNGFTHRADGERLSVAAHDVRPERGAYAGLRTAADGVQTQSDDYPAALWVPASSSNYSAGRSSAISAVVIHVTQGSYAGTISWFQNPEAQVSAHYVVRSSDGEITQMVREADTAWHARDGNSYAVGIEHEGYVDDPAWFTDVMYRSSAALTANIADDNGIPKDREHIVGHSEVPGNDHTDPGANWDWDLYMSYVTGGEEPDPEEGVPFTTWGSGVNVRADATTQSDVVGSLSGPTNVRVLCQKEGENVSSGGYSGAWWSKLKDQGGFIANIFVDHPDNKLPNVPLC
ncbi:N-acetylmuramoyl-L-alanine amidase [Solicola gregarius]|uniref:N-acetylmuramoyl-L-alanine amidase n=1 Tax=Solicola gregarius TaxID=2908642 RepID=A0AA46TL65_9ACTN|nr:N-acetylmuramoyl-L-alanine amidase [Solicola gregarius]UYM06458.1 N-acetylmuramoyl-L-alanine amidase [Solicola gregarius]